MKPGALGMSCVTEAAPLGTLGPPDLAAAFSGVRHERVL